MLEMLTTKSPIAIYEFGIWHLDFLTGIIEFLITAAVQSRADLLVHIITRRTFRKTRVSRGTLEQAIVNKFQYNTEIFIH